MRGEGGWDFVEIKSVVICCVLLLILGCRCCYCGSHTRTVSAWLQTPAMHKKAGSVFNCQGLVYVSILDMGSCIQVAGSKIIQSRQARRYDLKQSFWSEGQCFLAVSDGMGDGIAPISPSTLGSVPTCPRPGKRCYDGAKGKATGPCLNL
jgi:hypothetical protein